MRGIIWRLKRFESEDILKSSWPKGIKEHADFEKNVKKFENVVCIWLCVEKDDKEGYLDSLVERATELNEQFYKFNKAIVLPFAHLSNKLEKPKRAKEILNKLTEKLRERSFEVDRITFGTHKRALWEISGNVADVSYYEFPYSGEKPKVA